MLPNNHLQGVTCVVLCATSQWSLGSEDRDAGFSPAHQLLNPATCLSKCPVMLFLGRGTLSARQSEEHRSPWKMWGKSLMNSRAQARPSVSRGGERAAPDFQFNWINSCMCDTWGLVSRSRHTQESHLDAFLLHASTNTFSHSRQILSPHFRAGKSSRAFLLPLSSSGFLL